MLSETCHFFSKRKYHRSSFVTIYIYIYVCTHNIQIQTVHKYIHSEGMLQLNCDKIQLPFFSWARDAALGPEANENIANTHRHTHKKACTCRPVVHINWINNGPEPSLDIITEASGQHCSSLLKSLNVFLSHVCCLARTTCSRKEHMFSNGNKCGIFKQAEYVKLKTESSLGLWNYFMY